MPQFWAEYYYPSVNTQIVARKNARIYPFLSEVIAKKKKTNPNLPVQFIQKHVQGSPGTTPALNKGQPIGAVVMLNPGSESTVNGFAQVNPYYTAGGHHPTRRNLWNVLKDAIIMRANANPLNQWNLDDYIIIENLFDACGPDPKTAFDSSTAIPPQLPQGLPFYLLAWGVDAATSKYSRSQYKTYLFKAANTIFSLPKNPHFIWMGNGYTANQTPLIPDTRTKIYHPAKSQWAANGLVACISQKI